MVDVEIALAKELGWSLYDLDQTDIASLLPFVLRLTAEVDGEARPRPKPDRSPRVRRTYCDQVNL